jgi:hypothetical protein
MFTHFGAAAAIAETEHAKTKRAIIDFILNSTIKNFNGVDIAQEGIVVGKSEKITTKF